jgi:hypothetical protein
VSSGYSSSPSTQTTTNVPYLSDAVKQAGGFAQDVFNDPSNWPKWFPGSTVSGFTPEQTQALQTLEANASQDAPATDSSLGFANDLESGKYLTNPGSLALSAYSNAALDPNSPQAQAITAPVVSNIVSQFVQGGNLNNPSMAYAASQGAESALANAGITAATNLGNQWNTGVDAMTRGLALAPQTAGLPFIAPQQLFQAGSLQQNQNQADLNAQIQKWNFEQTKRQNMDNWLASIAYGAPGGTSTMTTPMYSNSGANDMATASSALSMVGTLAAMY